MNVAHRHVVGLESCRWRGELSLLAFTPGEKYEQRQNDDIRLSYSGFSLCSLKHHCLLQLAAHDSQPEFDRSHRAVAREIDPLDP